jgi:SEC-C motif-containing protein
MKPGPPTNDAHSLPCPCGSGNALHECCGRWIDGPLRLGAPDALSLMRSRYTAYVLERADYLLDTWHPSTRPPQLGFEPGLRWLGLQVRGHRSTGPDTAEVAFVARSKAGGRAHRLIELSRFRRECGRWVYVDGDCE